MKKFSDGQEILMEQQYVLKFCSFICKVLRIIGSRDPNNLHCWCIYICLTHSHPLWVTMQITTIFCPKNANGCSTKVTLIFRSCHKFSGCYNNMNFCNNEKWNKCELISNLPTSSLSITGNVTYHSAGQCLIKFCKLKTDVWKYMLYTRLGASN